MDTILTPELFERLSNNEHFKIYGKTREDMHTDGALFNISEYAKSLGVVHPASVTQHLFKELFPWAQDANHDITFDERVSDMITQWKREFKDSDKPYGDFEFGFKTHIKEYRAHDDIDVFPNGKSKTKTIRVFVACHGGDFNEPVLTFGLNKIKWAGE